MRSLSRRRNAELHGARKELLGKLGCCPLPGSRGITTYHSPVFLTDSLLGVDYVLSTGDPAGCSTASDEIELSSLEEKDVRLYRNGSLLGWDLAVPSSMKSVDWTGDPFDNQERYLTNLSGENATGLYSKAKVEASGSTAANGETTCSWEITAQQDGPLYLWMAAAPTGAQVSCDGKFLQTTRSYESDANLMYLGKHKAGDTAIVQLASSIPFGYDDASVEARSLDEEWASQMLGNMRTGQFIPSVLKNGRIEGTFSAPAGSKLLINIPATSGWTAKVDGKPAESRTSTG